MKIIHVGDIHLDGGFQSEESETLKKIVGIVEEKKPDLVIIPGDIFDEKSQPEWRLVFSDFLNRINHRGMGAKVVILRGNHDAPQDLMIFHDPPREIYVFEQPGEAQIFSADSQHVLTVHAIPHFNAGAIALQQNDLASYTETGTSLFGQILDGIFHKVRSSDGPSIVAAHCEVDGAMLDNLYIPRHNGIHLSLDKLGILGCPVMLNHLHLCQQLAPLVWYAGSITRRNYGESNGDKGVLLWTYESGEWLEPEFISLSPTPMHIINAEWKDGTWWCDGVEGLPKIDCAGARVSFRYTVKQSDLALVDIKPIKDFFNEQGVKELQIPSPNVQIKTAVRCEEMKEAQSPEDCFRVWAVTSKGEPEERADEALKLLNEILNPEQIAEGVSAGQPYQPDSLEVNSGLENLGARASSSNGMPQGSPPCEGEESAENLSLSHSEEEVEYAF